MLGANMLRKVIHLPSHPGDQRHSGSIGPSQRAKGERTSASVKGVGLGAMIVLVSGLICRREGSRGDGDLNALQRTTHSQDTT